MNKNSGSSNRTRIRYQLENELNKYRHEVVNVGDNKKSELDVNNLITSKIGISHEKAEELISSHRGKFSNYLIQFAFSRRESIKKIPIIGSYVVNKKRKMLDKAINEIQRIESKDFSHILTYDVDCFLIAAYKILFDREIDSAGLSYYRKMSREGAKKEAILYLLITSVEFSNKFAIKGLKHYKRIYNRYRNLRLLRKVPILGTIISISQIPKNIEMLNLQVEKYQSSSIQNLEIIKDIAKQIKFSSDEAYKENLKKMDTHEANLNESIRLLKNQVEFANQAVKVSEEKLSKSINKIQHDTGKFENEFDVLNSGHKKLLAWLDEHRNMSTRIENIESFVQGSSKLNSDKFKKYEDLINGLMNNQVEISSDLGRLIDGNINIATSYYSLTSIAEQTKILISDTLENTEGIIKRQTDVSNNVMELIGKVDYGNYVLVSLSEKVDHLPQFIANNGVKSKSSIGSKGVTAVVCNDFIVGVPSEEWGLAMTLSLTNHFEKGTEQLFERIINEDMCIVDIGANLGIYTLIGLRKGCRVVSYEPTPETFKLLKKNIKVNGFIETGKSELYCSAVADYEGTSMLSINKEMCGHNSLYDQDVKDRVPTTIVSIDNHLKHIPSIDVVKIDVEGAEYFVLKGMKETIKRNPNISIIIEFAPSHLLRAGIEPSTLIKFITDLGLDYKVIDERTGELQDLENEELYSRSSTNLLLRKYVT